VSWGVGELLVGQWQGRESKMGRCSNDGLGRALGHSGSWNFHFCSVQLGALSREGARQGGDCKLLQVKGDLAKVVCEFWTVGAIKVELQILGAAAAVTRIRKNLNAKFCKIYVGFPFEPDFTE
jgi:hypothetical protein